MVIDDILKFGFLTGSRAWGLESENSDWDICVRIYELDNIKNLLKGSESSESSYFNGVKYSTPDGVINIIPVHEIDYQCWMMATRAMLPIAQAIGKELNKVQRHGIFTAILGSVKACGTYE